VEAGAQVTAQCWSYGGGVQTAAIAALIIQGKLPVPDVTVIADTGRERTTTWEYLWDVVNPALMREVGIEVGIAGHSLSTVDLYGHNGDLLIPAFTGNGKLPTLCSTEWKKRVVRRYLRNSGYGPENPVQVWLGISVDEVHRAKDSDVAWASHRYPLLYDYPMRRDECVAIVRKMGWPDAPRSACWMCPHANDHEWRALTPDDMAKAVAFEAAIREKDNDLYLHRTRKLLPVAVLPADTNQAEMFDGCDSGFCYT
jgi:hypothetical protein